MDFHILGPLAVLEEGRDVPVQGTKQRALLGLLVLHVNETLSTDRVIDELWGDQPPATATKSVQVHVSRLRKALAAGPRNGSNSVLITREHGYELRVEPETVDSYRFEQLADDLRGSLPPGTPERRSRSSRWGSRCGAGRRSATWRTSRSRKARSRGSTSCAWSRWSG